MFLFLLLSLYYSILRCVARILVCQESDRPSISTAKMEDDFSRHRINAALISKYQGKQVCLLGKAKDVDQNGMYFTISTSDGQDVRVNMNAPLSEYLAGLTEVHGVVQGNSVRCENYVMFSEEASEKFNIALYNQAVEYMERCGEHYIQGVTEKR